MLKVSHIIKEQCLQRNYRKLTISWSFSYNIFVKFHGKKIVSYNMTLIYPNLCYDEVCYKETAMYREFITSDS